MTEATTGVLRGVIPPIITPIGSHGELDLSSLDSLVRYLLENGVDGIFALGSSGEAAYLTDDQREVVVDRILGQVAGQVPVLVGLLDTTPGRITEQGRHLIRGGVRAAVVTAPFYANLTGEEIVRHYATVAEALDVPVLAYNIPVNVHQALDPDLLGRLAETGAIVGVKDSSGDLVSLRRLIARLGVDRSQAVLTGSEALLDLSLLAGADGAVAGLSNVDPAAFVALFRAHEAGNHEAVATQQRRILTLLDLYTAIDPGRGLNSTQLGGMKLALHERGVIAHPNLSSPMAPPTDRQRSHVAGVLDALDRL